MSATVVKSAWVDDRGTLVPDWDSATSIFEDGWRVVPFTTMNAELTAEGRQGTLTSLRGLGPADTALTAADRLIAGGVTYECYGDPSLWPSMTGYLAHVEVTLRRVVG